MAMVQFYFPFGKGIPSRCVIGAKCWFWGDDVPADLDGQPFDLNIDTPIEYSLTDLKSAIVDAVQAQASLLDLTIVNYNINIPSYETG